MRCHRAAARHCTATVIATATVGVAVAVAAIAAHRHMILNRGSRPSAERVAEAKPTAPTNQNRSPWFPLQTRPRRTQCGVGADESFVTSVECERTRIPVAPLPVADHGAHLAGASSRFLLPTFLCGGKEK